MSGKKTESGQLLFLNDVLPCASVAGVLLLLQALVLLLFAEKICLFKMSIANNSVPSNGKMFADIALDRLASPGELSQKRMKR